MIEQPKKEEKKESEWKFSAKLTIDDMIRMKIPPSEIFAMEGMKINMRWISIVAMVNCKSVGKRLDGKSTMEEAMSAYEAVMTKNFLGK